MPSVIFDLDGTLADTSADLISAANACFRDLGLGDVLDPHRDKVTAFHGGRAMLRAGLARTGALDAGEVERQYPRLLDYYAGALCVQTHLYPGAMEAVERLKADGYAVGICTNKPEGLAQALLVELGVRSAFGALIGADTLPVRKPDPEPLRETVRRLGRDPARTCLIGDTDTDRMTARAAGVPSVLVTFSATGRAVHELEPEATIDHFDELSDVILGLRL